MIRSLFTIAILLFGALAWAQTAPAAPSTVAGFSLGTLGAIAGTAVLIVNALLSAAQSIFSALGKTAPGWFATASNIALWITQHLAGNPPSVAAAQATVAAQTVVAAQK